MTASTSTRAWFVGEGSLLVRCAEVYLRSGHTVAGIASSDPAVVRWADGNGIRHVAANEDLAGTLGESPYDYLFSVVNLTKLDDRTIATPRMLAVNFHDGPLPAYAGLNAPVWALLNGETTYGVTWHEMTDTVDAGRILKQQLFDIPAGETSFGLNARCYEAGLAAFTSLVDDITSGDLSAVEQSAARRTVYARFQRPAGHGVVDWNRPAAEIARAVRAMDFGPYQNPFGVVRAITRGGAFAITAASSTAAKTAAAPGTVLEIDANRIVVAAGSDALAIDGVRAVTGEPVTPARLAELANLRVGEPFGPSEAPADEALGLAVRHESFWLRQLAHLEPVSVPYAAEPAPQGESGARRRFAGIIPAGFAGASDTDRNTRIVAAVAACLARLSGSGRATFAVSVAAPPAAGLPLLSDRVPVVVDVARPWSETASSVAEVLERGTFFTDLCLRTPGLPSLQSYSRWRTHIVLDPSSLVPASQADAALVVRPSPDGATLEWDGRADVFSDDALRRLHAQWVGFARQLGETPAEPVASLPLVDAAERARLIESWNATAVPFDRACIHDLIEQQVRRTPDAVALIAGQDTFTYRELDRRANQMARHLQSFGVGPEVRVGLCLERSADLFVALVGVLKAGGAYVPLDPHYPQERLQLVAEDAEIRLVIADAGMADQFPMCDHVVCPTRDRAAIAALDDAPIGTTSGPENLAYIIYTSGSTGRPKGVMLEHQQVANFFAGMDACVPHDRPGVWLAVTSISFDISVLELFWTLARGFTVVLYTGESGTSGSARVSARPEPIDLSLFYFSADEGQDPRGKYRLLLEGAKFADTHGFAAVWTPERHFHAFGGLYPNPAVTGAAVAAITSRIAIRAGSCVLPLHHPLRVAEEWSVVDNISGGRVGIAFASGWQPNDFVLRPENYADRKNVLFQSIETVRALWRGESIMLDTPRGTSQEFRTLPRPVQPTLPVWVTAAGNPETFAAAATAGAGVLTHLLGQTVDELTTKIAAYRAAWKAAGHSGDGHVVLMLHTLVSDDDAFVREVVREPLMAYLKTSIDLVKPFAESFPTFAARAGAGNPSEIFASLSEEDYNALVEHSFERYFETSGLFGRPETCLAMIDRLKAIGVSEVACLVDFGVATDVVLENLPHLDALRQRANGIAPEHDDSIAGLIARHGVTHFQCTPSMARMLLLDPSTRAALGRLRAMFVGGEALPVALAEDLVEALDGGQLWNMYGPTETTVWSTVSRVVAPVESVTIGRPIANTQIYIVDAEMQPVPVGLPGDLYIGGDAVARGYWGRPELTAERFRPNPFATGSRRIYATGDLARYRDDGQIEFLGRSDHQVKIRGHRIELGEIETALTALPGIRDAVVVAREDHENDKRLVAYVIAEPGSARDGSAIRAALGASLPDFLVPSHVVFLDAFPLTPNNKIDRRALPAVEHTSAAARPTRPPATETEATVVDVWREVLRTEVVGTDDNFFDIGGDSLLAAQVLSLLRARLARPVSLTDLFRFPTVRALGAHLGGEPTAAPSLTGSTDRAKARQEAMRQRRGGRPNANAPAGTR